MESALKVWLPAVLTGVLTVCGTSRAQDTAEPPLPPRTPTWTRNYHQLGIAGDGLSPPWIAIAPGGDCRAVINDGVVEVIDPGGAVMWSWNHRKVNRFIGGALAVNSACDTVVFSGYNGYPYMWIARRNERPKYVRISAAPRSVTFDHSGRFIALGSGQKFVFLFTSTGEQLWKVDFASYYVAGLEFSPDDRHIIVTGEFAVGMIGVDGKIAWKEDAKSIVAYSPNLQTFLTSFQPLHFSAFVDLATYDGAGRRLWSDGNEDAEACAVNRTGDKIVVQRGELQMLSRSGELIRQLPAAIGCPMAFVANDERFVTRKRLAIEEVDSSNQRFWAIPLTTLGRNYRTPMVVPVWKDGALNGLFVIRWDYPAPQSDQLEWYAMN